MLKQIKNENGFTLLEILGAVTLLAVSLIPIMLIFYNGTFNTRATTYRNVAIDFAQQKMETIRNMSYDNITAANLPSDNPESGERTFTRTVTIVTSPTGFDSNMKQITVTVSWTDDSGNTKSVSLTSYRSKWL
ncbi:MAG: prepilin-type N-terminal cleavage/methylation domain-containing protein [Actinobacteria bacterium]|nr:prepilin-type N-terminal cleavage/methylation domain-containing protein [Actinomycetota bacterium]